VPLVANIKRINFKRLLLYLFKNRVTIFYALLLHLNLLAMLSVKKILFLSFIIASTLLISNSFTACKNNFTQQEIAQNQIELGRHLFFDRRLSVNNTRACATCHNPNFAFTDGYKRSLGAFADLHQRNTQPLFNLSYLKYFTAADSSIHSTLQQMEKPLFNTHNIEMGVGGHEAEILARIKNDKKYNSLFANAGYDNNWQNIKKAISKFEESIVSFGSPYDKFMAGDTNAISTNVKNGMKIFFSETTTCSSCHGGKNFSESIIKIDTKENMQYFNIGLYNLNINSDYPDYDKGLMEHTNIKEDMGKYRVPTLRNLAFTAPYFHDGSAASMLDVVEHYAAGGRNIADGIYKGDGSKNVYKHKLIKGFTISTNEKLDLIAFLISLSDSNFIKNKAYQNPFEQDETKY
jgi:cytochrome c peroxidase